MRQFSKVDSKYGAPMGREEWRNPPIRPHSVKVFRVHLDSGGYDDGGAYWGIGKPLYCATNDDDYRMFTRAESRLEALAEFRLAPFLLRAGCPEYRRLRALEARGCISARGVSLLQRLESLGYGN